MKKLFFPLLTLLTLLAHLPAQPTAPVFSYPDPETADLRSVLGLIGIDLHTVRIPGTLTGDDTIRIVTDEYRYDTSAQFGSSTEEFFLCNSVRDKDPDNHTDIIFVIQSRPGEYPHLVVKVPGVVTITQRLTTTADDLELPYHTTTFDPSPIVPGEKIPVLLYGSSLAAGRLYGPSRRHPA